MKIIARAEDFKGKAGARLSDTRNLNSFKNTTRQAMAGIGPSVANGQFPSAIRRKVMALVVGRITVLVFQMVGIARQASIDSVRTREYGVIAVIQCMRPGVRSMK